MKSKDGRHLYRFLLVFVLFALGLLSASPSMAFGWDYASMPLFLAKASKPNVMVVIDNSESMNSVAYSQEFSDYLLNSSDTANKKYSDAWYPCTAYSTKTHTCTCTSAGAVELNVLTEAPTHKVFVVKGLPSAVRCNVLSGTEEHGGQGLMVSNSLKSPDPSERSAGGAVPITSSHHRVVNACVLFNRANTAQLPATNNIHDPHYPVGSNQDASTAYEADYVSFLLNKHFVDSAVNELAVTATSNAGRLKFDMSKSAIVPKFNRLQAARMVVKAFVNANARDANVGLATFDAKGSRRASKISVKCALGDVAHINELEKQINTALKPSVHTPLAVTQEVVNHYFAGSDSPVTSRCDTNAVVVMTDGTPTGDFDATKNREKDIDGATDHPYNNQSLLDDIAEAGFKTIFKQGGKDSAGVSWTGSGSKKQKIDTYVIGFSAEYDLLRMTPLVNRVPVPATDVQLATLRPPNGSIKIASHGLSTGDPVLYETLTKEGSVITAKTTGLLQTLGGSLPSHLADEENGTPGLYFAIRLDEDHFALASSKAKAIDMPPIGIPITGVGTGTHLFSTGPGKSYFAQSTDELVVALGEAFSAISAENSAVSAVSVNASKAEVSTRVFQARFNTKNWSGDVAAYNIDIASGVRSVTPIWTANHPREPASGSVLTWNPQAAGGHGAGADFLWPSLNSEQQAALHSPQVLSWTRGEPVEGLRKPGSGLWGDVVNSGLQFVGASNEGYSALPGMEGNSYQQFVAGVKSSRTPMLVFGANDGMVRGIDVSMSGDTDIGQGKPLFAFLPNGVYRSFTDLNDNGVMDGGKESNDATDNLFLLSQPNYGKADNPHRFLVDGSPSVGDAWFAHHGGGLRWGTVMLGGAQSGGRFIYAIDVTGTPKKEDVLWEFSKDDDSVDHSPSINSLGYTFSRPLIGRMANGKWAAIFGNGYSSGGHKAQLFIVDIASGAVIKQIDTKNGGVANPNGLSDVQVQLGGAGGKTVQAVYGGDLRGNIWKFDVSDASEMHWKVAYGTAASPLPLFTATDRNGNPQPVTGGIALKEHGDGTLVFFGTGKYFEKSDTRPHVIAGGKGYAHINSLYGLLDNGTPIAGVNELVEQKMDTVLMGAGTNAGVVYRKST